MRALTLHGERDLRWESCSDPAIEAAGDVLVRVQLSAVCGSDLHPYLGRERGFDPGTIPGHELVGEVLERGPEVRGLAPGTMVHAPFSTSCGECRPCLRGLTSRCLRGELFGWRSGGRGLHGGQAEIVRVPLASSTLLEIPEGVGAVEALLLGDVLATGYHGARQAEIGPGSHVVVVGCGPVGLMAVVAAFELGAERVLAIDPVQERRRRAEALGAEASGSLEVAELLDGPLAGDPPGVDSVVEAVGSAEATRLAFDLLRPGGTLSSVGVHTRPELGISPVEAYDKNLTLRVGRCPARALMPRLVPLVLSRRWDLAAIVSHRMPLERGPEAYRMLAARAEGCCKIVLDVAS
ncbi:MAG: alcohol dehydrogenase [Acidobacteria bacterium]|nr:MAG: alcohol dehydrogenase [Acidobacteriota bacterium]REK09163.1 MAG: alcohol dehydrogenase [Acidobacteriota bacterium]